MSMDCHFNIKEAKQKGVSFTPNIVNDWSCSCFHGEGSPECECAYYDHNYSDKVQGYSVECPDGSKGHALMIGLFQCRTMNQEIKEWFLNNIISARIN